MSAYSPCCYVGFNVSNVMLGHLSVSEGIVGFFTDRGQMGGGCCGRVILSISSSLSSVILNSDFSRVDVWIGGSFSVRWLWVRGLPKGHSDVVDNVPLVYEKVFLQSGAAVGYDFE